MATHNFTRRTFTALAELIGDVESGKVNADTFRSEVIERFELNDQPTFKLDKFTKHADTQREHGRKPAGELRMGDTFCYNGLTLRVDAWKPASHPSSSAEEFIVLSTMADAGLGSAEQHSNGEPLTLVFYRDELV